MKIEIRLPDQLVDAFSSLAAEPAWHQSPFAIAGVSGLIVLAGSVVTHCFNQRSEARRRATERETLKLEHKNRRAERMQELQVEALRKLAHINEKLLPKFWSSPDYSSDEALSEVVFKMNGLILELDQYLQKWSYVLPETIIRKLREVIYSCNQGHWGVTLAESPEYQPNHIEIEAARQIVSDLEKMISDFKKLLGLTET